MGATPQFAAESDAKGHFVRQVAAFRDLEWERPRPGRFHLYVSLACPWAHRTIVVRQLKGLEDVVPMTILDPLRDELGWRFLPDVPDPVNGFAYLSEAYTQTDATFVGRVTVPTLYDTHAHRILNNESADVVRLLNAWGDQGPDVYPEALREEIDAINAWVYDDVNNGVYRTGFASSQEAYEESFDRLFAALDRLETHLAGKDFLVGGTLTEADVRLFTTLVRFDAVYVGHFKANRNRIADMPELRHYLAGLLAQPGWAATVDLDHIKRHYYGTHPSLNPSGIVPKGPALDPPLA